MPRPGSQRVGRAWWGVFLCATITTASWVPLASSVHELQPHTGAPEACDATNLSEQPSYSRPLVRQRWDRASRIAPNVCLLPSNGPLWDCFYAEVVSSDARRLCWWPIPASPPAGQPGLLEVAVDLGALNAMAERSLEISELSQLLGTGSSSIRILVPPVAARFEISGLRVVSARLESEPPACTPFDATGLRAAQSPAEQARWDAASEVAAGVCAAPAPPSAGQCQLLVPVPEGRDEGALSYLCWWGRRDLGPPDYTLEVSSDTLRAVLNAEERGELVKWALAQGYLTISARDPVKRATIKAALQVLGDVPDPVPPPSDDAYTVSLFGRLFNVTYFPRNGVLTPSARDGLGTWFWLNAFGAPNGFVGPSTIRAMEAYLAEHGQLPSVEDALEDLLLNYRPGLSVQTPGGQGTVEYVFGPGSPFALLPLARGTDGRFYRLRGDGTATAAVPPEEMGAVQDQLAAAKAIAAQVDFNAQPGTLAQDIDFLAFAVGQHPATSQIGLVLSQLGNGTVPAPEDIAHLFPPEAPRLRLGDRFPHGNASSAIANGDAYVLGMAAHTLVWAFFLQQGAIQPAAGLSQGGQVA